jgi:hypothetical protein
MSYDIYCYKSKIGRPDLDEAHQAIESEESNTTTDLDIQQKKLDIAKALTDFNPKFKAFKFDYSEISRLQNITIEEAKARYNHIELNPPEEELFTQITIFDNNVSLTIPFWYSRDIAKLVFKNVTEYLKIIRSTAGYLVYDPQTEQVFDPLTSDFDGLDIYIQTTEHVNKLGDKEINENKKPWWKFW